MIELCQISDNSGEQYSKMISRFFQFDKENECISVIWNDLLESSPSKCNVGIARLIELYDKDKVDPKVFRTY